MSYGEEIRARFAKTYARRGNAAHALREALGDERADRMKPHTLRARASDLLNHYEVAELIEDEKAAMQARGEPLPHYRGRTYRADLYSDEQEDPSSLHQGLEEKIESFYSPKTAGNRTLSRFILKLEAKLNRKHRRGKRK